jgi:hypothetical protein
MRDELLNDKIFDTMAETRVLIEKWRCYYNTIRDPIAPWDTGHLHQSLE